MLDPLNDTQSPATLAEPIPLSHGVVLAMRGGDVNWQENFALSPMGGKPWSDPDSLVLFFSLDAQECSNPVLAGHCSTDAPFWQLVLGIPPELARPGLIDLSDQRITEYTSITEFTGAMPCSSSGDEGTSQWGNLELINDGSALSAKLRDFPKFGPGEGPKVGQISYPQNIDGDYTAQTCGTLAPLAPSTPALAIRGADLSPSPADFHITPADSLAVFFGTLPDTCQDPWAAADCTKATRLSFTLPLALQKPGVISLADPAIAATYTAAAAGGTSACGLPTGPLELGTVEILSLDADGLTFKIYKSTAFDTTLTRPLFLDGLYHAPICP